MKTIIKIILLIIGFLFISLFYIFYGNPSENIILNIRIPRFILTLFVGFVLSGIGNIYQKILDNPLAEPYILGISSGSALGSIVATITGIYFLTPLFGFIGAIVTMFAVWKIATIFGSFNSIRLILSGIIIGMFFSSLISLLIYFNKSDIGSIFQVLMGNTGRIFSIKEWRYFIVIMIVAIFFMLYLFSLETKITIMTTGDLSAVSLGIDVKKVQKIIFVISSLLIGITVAYAGIVGFVGLIIPHLTRMIFIKEKKYHTLLASVMGALFLLICDFISAHIAVIEIPVGIITAFVGTPFFVYLMLKKR